MIQHNKKLLITGGCSFSEINGDHGIIEYKNIHPAEENHKLFTEQVIVPFVDELLVR